MDQYKILEILRAFTRQLDQANRGTAALPERIQQLEQILGAIDADPELKRNVMIKGEMRRCQQEIRELKRTVDALDSALMDTERRFTDASY